LRMLHIGCYRYDSSASVWTDRAPLKRV
jgi:hypothetical protein